MNLNLKEEMLVQDILKMDNLDDFIAELIRRYGNISELNCMKLLSLIPVIAKSSLNDSKQMNVKYRRAIEALALERYFFGNKRKKKDMPIHFASLLDACFVIFKDLTIAENHCLADKRMLYELIMMIKNKQVFDYDDAEDWDWVTSTRQSGIDVWLSLLIKRYIRNNYGLVIDPEKLLES